MSKSNSIKKYETNKSALVGDELVCPICGRNFIKKSYQQAFCCNDCKDRYWNQTRKKNGYFSKYNSEHPERLDRGFTKGYNNGNVSDGEKVKKRIWLNEALGIYIIGYDEIGRPITNSPLSDMLRNKEMEWHDDDWCEDVD